MVRDPLNLDLQSLSGYMPHATCHMPHVKPLNQNVAPLEPASAKQNAMNTSRVQERPEICYTHDTLAPAPRTLLCVCVCVRQHSLIVTDFAA